MSYSLSGHRQGITAVAIAPAGSIFVSAGVIHDGTIRCWSLDASAKEAGPPRLLAVAKVPNLIHALAFSSDGCTFVSVGRRHARVWALPCSEAAVAVVETVLDGRSAVLGSCKDKSFVDVTWGCSEASAASVFAITSDGLLATIDSRSFFLDRWIHMKTSGAYAIAVSAQLVAVGCADATVRFFDPISLAHKFSFVGSEPAGTRMHAHVPISAAVCAVRISSGSTCATVGFSDPSHALCAYSVGRNALLSLDAVISPSAGEVLDMYFAAGSLQDPPLVSCSRAGIVTTTFATAAPRVMDVHGAQLSAENADVSPISAFAVSVHPWPYVACGNTRGGVIIASLAADADAPAVFELGCSVSTLSPIDWHACDGGGCSFLAGTADGTVWAIDLGNAERQRVPRVLHRTKNGGSAVDRIRCASTAADGCTAYVSFESARMVSMLVAPPGSSTERSLTRAACEIALVKPLDFGLLCDVPDGLVAITSSGVVVRTEPASNGLCRIQPLLLGSLGGVRAVALDSTATLVAADDRCGGLVFIDLCTGERLARVCSDARTARAVRFSADSTQAAVLEADGRVVSVWRIGSSRKGEAPQSAPELGALCMQPCSWADEARLGCTSPYENSMVRHGAAHMVASRTAHTLAAHVAVPESVPPFLVCARNAAAVHKAVLSSDCGDVRGGDERREGQADCLVESCDSFVDDTGGLLACADTDSSRPDRKVLSGCPSRLEPAAHIGPLEDELDSDECGSVHASDRRAGFDLERSRTTALHAGEADVDDGGLSLLAAQGRVADSPRVLAPPCDSNETTETQPHAQPMGCAVLKMPASIARPDAFESAEIMSAESAAELQLLRFTAASAVCAESASTSTEAHLHLAQPRAQIPHAVATVSSTDDAGLASGLPPRPCSESPAKLDRRREPRLVQDVGGASPSPPPAATKPVPLDVQSCDEAFELLAERRAAYFAQSVIMRLLCMHGVQSVGSKR